MPDFSKLGQINEQNASNALEAQKHQETQLGFVETQKVILEAFKSLIGYMDKKVAPVQVVNQLKNIGTPDAMKVVRAIENLENTSVKIRPDYSEVVTALKGMSEQLSTLPREVPTFEQKDSVSISNLTELEDGIKNLKKAVDGLELNVEAPVVNVEKPDFKPVEAAIDKVVVAIKAIPEPKLEKSFDKTVKLDDGAVPTFQVNGLVTERFDEWKLTEEEFDDNYTISGIKYFYKKKLVAQLKFTIRNDTVVGAKRVK